MSLRVFAVRVPVFVLMAAAFRWFGPASAATFTLTDGVLKVATDRYTLRWENGVMTRLVTQLPREIDLTAETAMGVDDLPNGLGSFHGKLEAGRKQHFPVGGGRLPLEFPAQHPARPGSTLTSRELADGIELTYTGLEGEPGAVLVQALTVDPGTGDLVIRQRGSSPNPGVFGIGFSLLNLRADTTYLVPFFGSQRWSRERNPDRVSTIGWARFWQAALVIGEVAGGGTFCVWAQDPDMHAKYFHFYNTAQVQGLGFEACAEAPYEERTRADVFEWRFNTFAGNWTEPAERYKRWMVDAYGLVPRRERAAPWVRDIALFWPNGVLTEERLGAMAERLDPKHVLVHNWGMWHGFNRRVPEYTPRDPKYAERAALAHRMGYRLGGYVSMLLVDVETHPEMMREYGLDYVYDALTRDRPAPPPEEASPAGRFEHWLVAVHPGSRKWREFYVGKMAMLNEEVGVDLLYQDVSGGPIGSAGVIDGLTRAKAVPVIEEAIRRRLPDAGLMGEYWTEVNVCREDFGINNYLSWFSDDFKRWMGKRRTVQPLLSYLFSDYCIRMAHSKPFRNVDRFHREENINEVTGTIPYWHTSVTDAGGEARLTLLRAGLWADGFRPWFPRDWDPDVIAYMRNDAGEVVRYRADGESTYCFRDAPDGQSALVYARLLGVDRVEMGEPVSIEPWLAYGPRGPIGLDPQRWYCLFPGAPAQLPLTLTALPGGAVLSGARVTEEFCLLQLDGEGRGTVRWHADRPFLRVVGPDGAHPASTRELDVELPAELLFVYREPAPSAEANDEILRAGSEEGLEAPFIPPLREWPPHTVSHGWITEPAEVFDSRMVLEDGRRSSGLRLQPPSGGTNVEHTLEGVVTIPDDPAPELRLVAGMLSGGPSDGVHFVVRVNGRELWRRYWTSRGGEAVAIPLAEFRGREVLLSLGVDCGPAGHHLSCDGSFWGSTRIERGTEDEVPTLPAVPEGP